MKYESCNVSEIILVELGDYDPQEHVGNYAGEEKLFMKQSQSLEEEMMEIHQTETKGQTLEIAETNFLLKASGLDSYGVDPHSVKVHNSHPSSKIT